MTRLPKQRTIAGPAVTSGFGFFTNAEVKVTFLPAEPDTGIMFVRADLPGRPEIPAQIDFAVERHRRTALERHGAGVELTEHVLAALAGLEIDNCLVELDGPEPPGGDGSARHFVDALLDAGIVEQDRPAAVFGVLERVSVGTPESAFVVATPLAPPLAGRLERSRLARNERTPQRGNDIRVSSGPGSPSQRPDHNPSINTLPPRCVIRYELGYGPDSPIPPQHAEYALTPEIFAAEIASARTFILESEIAALRARGYGEKVSSADLLVFGKTGVIGNVLRTDNECARHKLLDCIGDFALMGGRIAGRFEACRSGHATNRDLVRRLLGGMTRQRKAA